MRLKRTALRFLVAYSVVFTLLLLNPVPIHRYEFDRAFVAWYKNPSVQNTAVLRKEKDRNRIAEYSSAAGLALVVILVASSGYWALRRVTISGTEN
jgi:hypothetical protein